MGRRSDELLAWLAYATVVGWKKLRDTGVTLWGIGIVGGDANLRTVVLGTV